MRKISGRGGGSIVIWSYDGKERDERDEVIASLIASRPGTEPSEVFLTAAQVRRLIEALQERLTC